MTTKTATLTFSTRDYERTHGRAPRGRGSWAFCPLEDYHRDNYLAHTMWSTAGLTLSAAKSQARAYYTTTEAGRAALAGKSGTIVVCT